MQLEQMFENYQSQISEPRQQTYFVVGNLESLSASALYSDSKNIVKKDGTIETVLPKFINNDTLKIYINPLTGKTNAGYQNGGEKHREYSGSDRMTNLDRGSRS